MPLDPPRSLVIMGVAGAGKTTIGRLLADELAWSFIDGDDFHSPDNRARMAAGIPLTDADRNPWLAALNTFLQDSGRAGRNVVLACSALKRQYRQKLTEGVAGNIYVYLQVDPVTLANRLRNRPDHFMPAGLLSSQLSALEEPDEGLTVDATPPPDQVVAAILNALRQPNLEQGRFST